MQSLAERYRLEAASLKMTKAGPVWQGDSEYLLLSQEDAQNLTGSFVGVQQVGSEIEFTEGKGAIVDYDATHVLLKRVAKNIYREWKDKTARFERQVNETGETFIAWVGDSDYQMVTRDATDNSEIGGEFDLNGYLVTIEDFDDDTFLVKRVTHLA